MAMGRARQRRGDVSKLNQVQRICSAGESVISAQDKGTSGTHHGLVYIIQKGWSKLTTKGQ